MLIGWLIFQQYIDQLRYVFCIFTTQQQILSWSFHVPGQTKTGAKPLFISILVSHGGLEPPTHSLEATIKSLNMKAFRGAPWRKQTLKCTDSGESGKQFNDNFCIIGLKDLLQITDIIFLNLIIHFSLNEMILEYNILLFIEFFLKQPCCLRPVFIKNMRIYIQYHIWCRVTRIPLDCLDITICCYKFIGYARVS